MITEDQIVEESYGNLIIDLYNETRLSAEVIECAGRRFGATEWDVEAVGERANTALERLDHASIDEMKQHIETMLEDLESARRALVHYQGIQRLAQRTGMLRFMIDGAIKRITRIVELAHRGRD